MALGDRLADLADRLDFGRGKTDTPELVGARLAYRFMTEWHECGKQPVADRRGGSGRQLLAADDGAQTGKARFAPAQVERTGLRGNRLEARVMQDQLREGGFE